MELVPAGRNLFTTQSLAREIMKSDISLDTGDNIRRNRKEDMECLQFIQGVEIF